MMKKIVVVIAICLSAIGTQAQEIYNSSGRAGKATFRENAEKKGFDANKLIFGGGLGFGMGSGVLSFGISPIIGYRITDRFAAGISLGYQYYRVTDFWGVYNQRNNGQLEFYNLNQSMFSGGVWARYIVWDNIFLHSEFEYNITRYKAYQSDNVLGVRKETITTSVPCLLLGGGYRQPVADNLSFVIVALYDVLQNIPSNQRTDNMGRKFSISPYADRLEVRIGVNIGF
jgi:hypothetical protein